MDGDDSRPADEGVERDRRAGELDPKLEERGDGLTAAETNDAEFFLARLGGEREHRAIAHKSGDAAGAHGDTGSAEATTPKEVGQGGQAALDRARSSAPSRAFSARLIERSLLWILGRLVPDARIRGGEVLAERFELREFVGSGAVGRVFRGWDRQRRRSVALKIFDVAPVGPEELTRYTAVIADAALARHPAVVLPLDPMCDHAPPFAAFESLAGSDLAGLCTRGVGLSWPRAVEIVSVCAEALGELHRATGFAHRALKPTNVWLTDAGETRVLDFGVAELGVKPVPARPDGLFVEYRAPEQIEGAPGDERSDVFTLGTLLLELVTGIPLFSGPSAFKAAHQALAQTSAVLNTSMSVARLPEPVERLLRKALARRPEDRYAGAFEFLHSLTIARQAVGAVPAPPAARSAHVSAEEQAEFAAVRGNRSDDSTTMIRVPRIRMASSSLQTDDGEVTANFSNETKEASAPPLLGSGTSTERDPGTRLDEKGNLETARNALMEQLPPLRFEEARTAVFSVPVVEEKTEILGSGKVIEQTERVPALRVQHTVERTQILPVDTSPITIARASPVTEATLCDRRSVPEQTLLLPQESSREGSPVGSQRPPEGAHALVGPRLETAKSGGNTLWLNLLLAILILCSIVALIAR